MERNEEEKIGMIFHWMLNSQDSSSSTVHDSRAVFPEYRKYIY